MIYNLKVYENLHDTNKFYKTHMFIKKLDNTYLLLYLDDKSNIVKIAKGEYDKVRMHYLLYTQTGMWVTLRSLSRSEATPYGYKGLFRGVCRFLKGDK